MFNQFYNPYQQYMPSQHTLPQQQIIQVNGKASVDTIQLAPNSSVLVMDTSAPIVWMCVSDGVGKVTSTPYDITVHEEKPTVDMVSVESRLDNLEKTIKELEGKINDKPNANRSKSKSLLTDSETD